MRTAPILSVLSALLLTACATSEEVNDLANIQPTENLMAAVYSPARPAEDVARDEARLPLETITFAGVFEGATVAELVPGGGYYTRILSQAVGPMGKVYALVPARAAQREGGLDAINAIAVQYENVEVVVVESFGDLMLSEQADMVWTTENYHDLANGDIAAVNRAAYAALRPGGIYYVQDHAAPGTGMGALPLHRIDPAAVREQVTAAGFRLEAQSDHLANPADTHAQTPFDYNGTTDKFAYRFRRP